MKNKNVTIGIVTTPIGKAGITPLLNIINIMLHFSNSIYIITGNEFTKESILNDKIDVISIYYNYDLKGFAKVIQFVSMQLKISFNLFKIARNIDFFIFFYGGTLILPMLTSKILNKKVILLVAGSGSESSKSRGSLYSEPLHILERINYTFANRIILYSPNLIKEYNLEKYRNKILIAHKHFINFDMFKIKKKFYERDNLVGYIGRLSREKGVLNFVKAIPAILNERDNLEFLIGGDGQLRDKIERYLEENNLNNNVKLAGWIPHDELSDYLNDLKLLVLPSYTEGLPNIMLEAMACSTPVLATPVGAIPDIIKDEETGFILENNNPECIAENIERVLNYPKLDEITESARRLVEKEFTYEAAVERYREILENV